MFIKHLHRRGVAPVIDSIVRELFPRDFVLHSLRHTMLIRLGETLVDAFTMMRIADYSSIVVSRRYIRRTPESVEGAFESLQRTARRQQRTTPGRRVGALPVSH